MVDALKLKMRSLLHASATRSVGIGVGLLRLCVMHDMNIRFFVVKHVKYHHIASLDKLNFIMISSSYYGAVRSYDSCFQRSLTVTVTATAPAMAAYF